MTLPQNLIDILKEPLEDEINNPTGIWADFNCLHRAWRSFYRAAELKLINDSDVPDEPDPDDYTDTDSEATVECRERCCGRFTFICICEKQCDKHLPEFPDFS